MLGFDPIIDEKTSVLILGSFPSARSLQDQQYYGHPQNHFWKILGSIIGEDLYSLPYHKRIPVIKKHNIGIWDVYTTCERKGSLDANIKNPTLNDFERIARACPKLKTIIFNGQTAGKHKAKVPINAQKHIVPSSSPANTMRWEEKAKVWKKHFPC